MKIDPYYDLQNVGQCGTIVFGYSRRFPGEEASNDSRVVKNGNFQLFRRQLFSETLEMRPALLHSDMQSVVSFSDPKMRNLE